MRVIEPRIPRPKATPKARGKMVGRFIQRLRLMLTPYTLSGGTIVRGSIHPYKGGK